MTSNYITVRGQKVSNRSQRRYIVVRVRAEAVTTEEGTFVAFAEIEKRSDSITTARKAQQRSGWPHKGAVTVVVDTETGEEV